MRSGMSGARSPFATEACVTQSIAFVFPGQGSQAVGMGADVYRASPAARAVYEAADAALGFSLSDLCFNGPEDALRETINTQPALVTTSLALLAALQEAAGAAGGAAPPSLRAPLTPTYLAGHSVGEYAALAVAGALGVTDVARLARERGRLMHREGVAIPSGMAAVLGMDPSALEQVCAEATRQARAELASSDPASAARIGAADVVIANDNAPGQIVISGANRALALAMEGAKAGGAKRVIPLPVSGAFHSPVLAPAAEALGQAVREAPLRDAAIPIVSNISAAPLTSAASLRDELPAQVVSPVQWTRSVEWLAAQGVTLFVEIGPGQVLSGLIKRIARGAATTAVNGVDDLSRVVEQVRAALA